MRFRSSSPRPPLSLSAGCLHGLGNIFPNVGYGGSRVHGVYPRRADALAGRGVRFRSVRGVPLFGGAKPMAEVSAGHTIYLEELGLKPGDFVSYFAKASDTDAVQGSKTTTSDIYFVQIRPFKKDYKPAQSQAQGGGGGGGGQQVGQLSQQQREIVSATFNVVRDKAKTKPEKGDEKSWGKLTTQFSMLTKELEGAVSKKESFP